MKNIDTKGQLTRQRILDTAMDLLNTKGYSATTMNDIINATGVQKGNLYYHFSSKEVLVTELVKSAGKSYGNYLSEKSGKGSPIERLLNILDAVLSFHRERGLKGGCLFANLAMETADTVPAVAEAVKGVFDSGTGWFESLITQAKKSGAITPDTDSMTTALRIVAGIEGSILLARLSRDISILEKAVEAFKKELSKARP